MKGARVVWTPQDDAYLIRTHRAITARRQAEDLHKPYLTVTYHRQRLYKEGRLDRSQQCYHPGWTPDQDDWLIEHYSLTSLVAICRHLRRSPMAVQMRKRRLGLHRSDGYYNARMLGEIFHKDPKVFAWFAEQGWLKGTRAPYHQGLNRPWVFSEEAVTALIGERPWLFNHRRMESHWFRSLVEREWDRDPWYNLKEASRVLGTSHDYVDLLALKGYIETSSRQPEKRWSKRYVRRSELVRWMAQRDGLRRHRIGEAQRAAVWRKRGILRVAMVWRARCPLCGQVVEVRTPPKLDGPQVMRDLHLYHQCDVPPNGHEAESE